MYSTIKSVQYLIAMLKHRGIRRFVVSPGTSHNAIVRSMEEDDYFTTYSVVDERSAAFFAIGLIQAYRTPVGIVCTAGTALGNYYSGVTEAYIRKLPLIVISADKNPYYLNQSEDQMIDQINLLGKVTKYSITMPLIRDSKDEWYCNRILNEVFLEMDHHGQGPVHINVPIEKGVLAIDEYFNAMELPEINVIDRYDSLTEDIVTGLKFKSLIGKKVLIIFGQDDNYSSCVVPLLDSITQKINCVVAVDKLSNIYCESALEISKSTLLNRVDKKDDLFPDVVITLGGNILNSFKQDLKQTQRKIVHWTVSEEGKVVDPLRKLNVVFEYSTEDFLELMDKHLDKDKNQRSYYESWKKEIASIVLPEFRYSNLYAVQRLMSSIPGNSILHLGNSTTVRIAQFFDLDKTVKVYCNRGANGIDGSVSSFIAQSYATEKLSYLIIGDLSFFYDQNGIWNKYINKNVRIMLLNNEGAALFHFNQGLELYPSLNKNIAAHHNTSAEGWVKERGFRYLSARNKKEFDLWLDEFLNKVSDIPIFFEIFTEKEEDAELQHDFYNMNSE